MTHPQLLLTPVHDRWTATPPPALVARVQVPALAQAVQASLRRPSLNLALVIDASHSMGTMGQTGHRRPLDEAKDAALQMIQQLADTDRVAIVVYGEDAQVLLPSTPAAEAKTRAQALLAQVDLMGNTALHKGWLIGAQQLAPFVQSYGLSRVLLLSDGQANRGVTGVAQITQEARELANAGISTSTYGLGAGFNETLMTAMAQDGQAFYAATAEALIPYFASEFILMSQTVGTQVRLQLTATQDGQPLTLEGLNEYAQDPTGWRLPPLVAGNETWAAFRLPQLPQDAHGVIALHAELSWMHEGVAHRQTADHAWEMALPGQIPETHAWAEERVKEVDAARIAREALRQAQQGQWAAAMGSLNAMSASAGNNAYIRGVADTLLEMAATGDVNALAKEASYSAHTMRSRVSHTHEAVHEVTDALGLRKVRQGQAANTGESPSAADTLRAAGQRLATHLAPHASPGSFGVRTDPAGLVVQAFEGPTVASRLQANDVPTHWEGHAVRWETGPLPHAFSGGVLR